MPELKVRKFSPGVVPPKEAVNRLGAREGERLFLIEGPDGAYQLTPHDPEFEKKMARAEDLRATGTRCTRWPSDGAGPDRAARGARHPCRPLAPQGGAAGLRDRGLTEPEDCRPIPANTGGGARPDQRFRARPLRGGALVSRGSAH